MTVTGADADADDVARRCAQTMFATDLTAQQLGIAVGDVTAGAATATMTVAEDMVNGHGTCHGGYVFLLADTAFAFACNTYDVVTVAATADIVFLRPAGPGERLVARAVERVRAGRSGIYDVTVSRERDGAVVAEFRGGSRSLRDPILSEPLLTTTQAQP